MEYDEYNSLIYKGVSFHVQERYEEAIECFDRALRIKPDNFFSLKEKGASLHSLGRYEEAIDCFDCALKIKSIDHDCLRKKGTSLHFIGRYEEAIECFDLALKINPEDYLSFREKGTTLSSLERNEEAIECYDQALKIKPDDYFSLSSKGTYFYSLGRYEEAIVYYDHALTIKPDLWHALVNKAQSLEIIGNSEDAIVIYDFVANHLDKIKDSKLIGLVNTKKYSMIVKKKDTKEDVVSRDLAIMHLEKAKNLMKTGKHEEVLMELKQALDTSLIAKAYDVFLHAQTILGQIMMNSGGYEEALDNHYITLKTTEDYLIKDLNNKNYQSIFQMNYDAIETLGNIFHNMGHYIHAKNCYDLDLTVSQKLLQADPENLVYNSYVGRMYENLGNLLYFMDSFEEAKKRYEKGLGIFEKMLQVDPENVAYQSHIEKILVNLSNLFLNLGRFKEAKQKFETALEFQRKILETDPENVIYQSGAGALFNDLGNLLKNMGLFEEAKKRFEKALEIFKKILNKDPENIIYQSKFGKTLINYGLLLYTMGRLDEAKIRLEEALEIRNELLKKYPENVEYQSIIGGILNNLGMLFYAMGRFEEAKQRYDITLEIFEKLLKSDPENVEYQPTVAMTLNNLGNLLYDLGNLKKAKQRLEESLEIRKKLLITNPENIMYQFYVGRTLNNLGCLLYKMGRLEEAKIRLEEALEIRNELLKKYPENVEYQSGVGGILNNLGCLISKKGRFEEAKQRYDKALEIYENLLKSDPENVMYKFTVAKTLNNLGNILIEKKEYSSALDFNLKALHLILDSANSEILYEINMSIGVCYEMLFKYDKAFIFYEESIRCVESSRNQYFIEEIKLDFLWNKEIVYALMISLLCNELKNSEKAWEYLERIKSRTLLDSLRLLEFEAPKILPPGIIKQEKKLLSSISALDRLIRKTEKADKRALLIRKIKGKESELSKIYDRIRELSPEYVDLRKGEPLNIKEIKDFIGTQKKKIAFVEYYINYGKIFIFVMRSDEKIPRVEIKDLNEKKLKIYVKKYIDSIKKNCETEEILTELSKYIIDPIFKYLKNCELVYLIPYGFLHYLPLHALLAENKRLIEHFQIVYSPSLTALKYSQHKPDRKFESCLSMGYTPYEKEKKIFEGEANLVANLFNVEPKLGTEATSKLLKNASNDVIHISCHGGFDRENPLNSGLKLADKYLRIEEIFDLKLSTHLLILSACETGLNKQKPGDELVGLTRAFMYAGADSLIVSLWSVMASSTFLFMERFYSKIKGKNMNKAEALQQTQLEFINDLKYNNPKLWAPFVLIGDWK